MQAVATVCQVGGANVLTSRNQVEIDGLILSTLVKFYKLPKELAGTIKQRILSPPL